MRERAPSPARRPAASVAAGLDRPAIAYLIASMLLGVGGQVALKAAVTGLAIGAPSAVGAADPLWVLGSAVSKPDLWAGLILYLSGTFFWLLALSRAPLGVLYPFTGLNFVLVLLPSALLLHERIGPLRSTGALLIALGVILHARDLRQAERRERAAGTAPGRSDPRERQP